MHLIVGLRRSNGHQAEEVLQRSEVDSPVLGGALHGVRLAGACLPCMAATPFLSGPDPHL